MEFLLERIESKQKYGGAELFVRCEPQVPGEVSAERNDSQINQLRKLEHGAPLDIY